MDVKDNKPVNNPVRRKLAETSDQKFKRLMKESEESLKRSVKII